MIQATQDRRHQLSKHVSLQNDRKETYQVLFSQIQGFGDLTPSQAWEGRVLWPLSSWVLQDLWHWTLLGKRLFFPLCIFTQVALNMLLMFSRPQLSHGNISFVGSWRGENEWTPWSGAKNWIFHMGNSSSALTPPSHPLSDLLGCF